MKAASTILDGIRIDPDGSTMRGMLTRPGARPVEIWIAGRNFEVADDSADALVLGALLPAMEVGAPLIVRGSVTPTLIASLDSWQQVWVDWRPRRYSAIPIEADSDARVIERRPETLAAFTGGVDSMYAIVNDQNGEPPQDRAPISKALLVHGQDIPLDRPATFDNAVQRVSALANALGVDLLVAATNIRSILPSIEDGHGLLLAAVLTSAAQQAGAGLISASFSEIEGVLDWGSNPITDPLMTSGRMRIVHEGEHLTRVDKLAVLASQRPDLLSGLLVCPHRPEDGGNCGQCEKCVRNWLAMRAIGVEAPACFPQTPDPSRISGLSPVLKPFYAEIAATARRNGHRDVEREVLAIVDRRPPFSRQARTAVRRVPGLASLYAQGRRYLGK
jgi:hypothetical protein